MRETVFRGSLTVYVALLVAPAAALLSGPEWPLFGGGLAVGAVGGALASSRIEPESVLTWPRVVAGLALPLGWGVPMVTTAESLLALYLSPWFAGACAAGVWILVALVAYHIRQQERIAALTELATFEARPPERQRRQLRIAAAVLLGGTIVAASAMVVVAAEGITAGSFAWLPAVFSSWLVIFVSRNDREVAVTDEGLRVQQTIHGWDTFEAYRVTDDALELSRSKWYHSDFRYDRGDIEDVEAVTEALSRYLPREQ